MTQTRAWMLVIVFFALLASVVSAQQSLPEWITTEAIPSQPGGFTIYNAYIATYPDESWAVAWDETSSTPCAPTDPCGVFYRKFSRNGQPGQIVTIVHIPNAAPFNFVLQKPIVDSQGNTYFFYVDPTTEVTLKLAKIDATGNVLFRRRITQEPMIESTAGQSVAFLGSDNQFSIIYLNNVYEKKFMRVDREGTVIVAPVLFSFNGPWNGVADGRGSIYFFQEETLGQDARVIYYKVNERDGLVTAGPITIASSLSYRTQHSLAVAYAQGKLHFLWNDDIPLDTIFYAQFDAITNQPVIARQQLYVAQNPNPTSERVQVRKGSLLLNTEGSRINIFLLEKRQTLYGIVLDGKLLLMQIDGSGAVQIPLTTLIDRARGFIPERIDSRPTLASSQISDRPHALWLDNSLRGYHATMYDPKMNGPENPNLIGCNSYALQAPLQSGQNYYVAASFGTSPGIPLSDGRRIPLNPDALFFLSSQFIRNQQGTFDAAGRANFGVTLNPNLPHGLQFYLALMTVGPQGVGFISQPKSVQVRTVCS